MSVIAYKAGSEDAVQEIDPVSCGEFDGVPSRTGSWVHLSNRRFVDDTPKDRDSGSSACCRLVWYHNKLQVLAPKFLHQHGFRDFKTE